jgi:exonuclease SbcD
MPRVLHFADAHIDMANYGRHDPETGLPLRVLDYLKSLDAIVDTAVNERVDLVIFAGDAYKDRTPAPTFQREWGKRIMRLSRAGIPTLLLVGNHDVSPAAGRAYAISEFDTLEVPHVRVISRPVLLTPDDLEGVPLQVIALPWVSRSTLMAALANEGKNTTDIYAEAEIRLTEIFKDLLDQVDPSLPVILTAHASVQGAVYGAERSVMLGGDLVLSGALVRNPRLDYVALGHIHKAQNLNPDGQPPVIYPGSIERIDFGEVDDRKGFVIADVRKKNTSVDWRWLTGIRSFIDRKVILDSGEDIPARLEAALSPVEKLEGAIVRLVIEYPYEWEAFIDEPSLRKLAEKTFEFHLVKRPRQDLRLRLPNDKAVATLSPLELMDVYWKTLHTGTDESTELQALAREVIEQPEPAPEESMGEKS